MLSRLFGILVAPWLFAAALILPLSPDHATNALVVGTLAVLLCGFSFVSDRARAAVALLGGWVAMAPFVLHSTFLDAAATLPWGVVMFVAMGGPFSSPPEILRVPAQVSSARPRVAERADLPRAA